MPSRKKYAENQDSQRKQSPKMSDSNQHDEQEQEEGFGSTLSRLIWKNPKAGHDDHPEADVSDRDLLAEAAAESQPTAGSPMAHGSSGTAVQGAPAMFQVQSGKEIDFEAVYRQAGITPEQRARITQVQTLINGLPAGTDKGIIKQLVSASLNAFSVPASAVVTACQSQIRAVDGYLQTSAADTNEMTAATQAQIEQLKADIANLEKMMQERVAQQQAVVVACDTEKKKVSSLLEYFDPQPASK
jgi:hypothetical protein